MIHRGDYRHSPPSNSWQKYREDGGHCWQRRGIKRRRGIITIAILLAGTHEVKIVIIWYHYK
jgi:hypothetical protein